MRVTAVATDKSDNDNDELSNVRPCLSALCVSVSPDRNPNYPSPAQYHTDCRARLSHTLHAGVPRLFPRETEITNGLALQCTLTRPSQNSRVKDSTAACILMQARI